MEERVTWLGVGMVVEVEGLVEEQESAGGSVTAGFGGIVFGGGYIKLMDICTMCI